jgi:hypothetical protein
MVWLPEKNKNDFAQQAAHKPRRVSSIGSAPAKEGLHTLLTTAGGVRVDLREDGIKILKARKSVTMQKAEH